MKSLLSSDSPVRKSFLVAGPLTEMCSSFYAPTAMACLCGCFIGFGSAIGIQANITPLAARFACNADPQAEAESRNRADIFVSYVDVIIRSGDIPVYSQSGFSGTDGKNAGGIFFGSLIGVSMGMFIVALKNAGRRQNRAHA